MAQFTSEEMDQLRTLMYGGFVKKSVPRYEMRGAGSGRAKRQTGYNQVTDYDAYNSGLLGRARDAAGIKKVNKDDEIRRIYDFIGGYQPPAQAAAPAPAAPAPLMPQISEASEQYRAETQALSDQIAKQQADFDASQAAAAQSKAIAAANQSRSFQAPNLQIQPASSTPKTAGTDAFRIRKRRGSNRNQLTSSLNIGQSNTLNI
jgi:hypothetical protein